MRKDWHNNFYPLASDEGRDVANLTERKNLHTPVYCVKELSSVCLSLTNFDLKGSQCSSLEAHCLLV